MKMTKLIAFVAVLAISLVASARTLPNGFSFTDSGPVVPGEWTCQYTKAMELAQKEHIPIVAMLVKADCGYCKKMETCWMQNESFRNELKKRGYILLIGVYPTSPEYSKVVGLTPGSGSLPLMGTYWLKEDGTEQRTKFVGRMGSLGVPNQGAANDSASGYLETGLELLARLTKDLGEYKATPDNTIGECAENQDELDRMEFDASTTSTYVRVTRDEKAVDIVTNGLVIVKNKAGQTTQSRISWPVAARTADANTQEIEVTIPSGSYKAGDKLTVYVADQSGKMLLSTNSITCVNKPVSAGNPKWLGETIDFGEWTTDLDAAKKLVAEAEGEAYTLVYIAGTRWCPDCKNTDENFLSTGDFQNWATTKKVALAVVDIPNYTTTNSLSEAGTKLPTIKYATMLKRDYFTKDEPSHDFGTGLGYLTRKGVSTADADEVFERNKTLVQSEFAEGGYHNAIEDTSAQRMGVPTFVILRKDGSIAARLTRLSVDSPKDKTGTPAYLARLNEALEIASSEGTHADAKEGANNTIAGAIELAASGEEKNSLAHVDTVDLFKITGVDGNASIDATVKGDVAATITLQYYFVAAGETNAVKIGSARKGNLKDGVKHNTLLDKKGTCYLSVSIANTEASVDVLKNGSTFLDYTVETKTTYVPTEIRADATVAEGGEITVRLVKDRLYRFDGLAETGNESILKPETNDPLCKYFTALANNDAVLKAKPGTFAYQLWVPGQVGFVETARTVSESVCDADGKPLQFEVSRTAGQSGEVKVDVKVSDASIYEGNFELQTTSLTWGEGVMTNQFVAVMIEDDLHYCGDGTIVLELTLVGETGEVVGEKSTLTISVKEDDKAAPGNARITGVAAGQAAKKDTIYAVEGEAAAFSVIREKGNDGLVAVNLASSIPGVTFATEDPRDLEGTRLYWENHAEVLEKAVSVVGVPAGKTAKISMTAVKPFAVKTPSSISVVGIAKDAPAFDETEYTIETARYVAIDEQIPLRNTVGGKLSVSKLSGSVPAGVKVTVANDALVISGVPTKASTPLTAYYQVTETRGKTSVSGLPVKLTIGVIDPTAVGSNPTTGGALNDSCKVTRTFSDVMVVDPKGAFTKTNPTDTSKRQIYGFLTLTLPTTGKASAKLICEDGTISFSAKNWTQVDLNPESSTYGQLTSVLTSTGKGPKYELTVRANNDEKGSVEIDVSSDSLFLTIPLDGRVWSKTDSAEHYRGYFTVTLPAVTDETTGETAELAPTGSSFVTVKMTSASDFAKGKMTWSGVLANGAKVSGSTTLNRLQADVAATSDPAAYLPIFKVSKTDIFSAPLEMSYDSMSQWESGDSECVIIQPMIKENGDDVYIYGALKHRETSGFAYAQVLNIYGAPYEVSKGLDCCSFPFYGTTNMTVYATMPAASNTFGKLGPVTALPVVIGETTISVKKGAANPEALTLSFDSKTGLVKGSFKLPVENGKIQSATFNGIVVLGWNSTNCGECGFGEEVRLPLVTGHWTFSDKWAYTDAKGKTKTATVKRGGAINIE